MRKAESPFRPWFGHLPQDFGMPVINGNILDTAIELDALEQNYSKWLRHPLANLRLKIAEPAVRIFRDQLYIAIRAYSRAVNDLTAAQQQAEQVKSNLPMIQKRGELRNFLLTYFPKEIEAAEHRNTDLTDVTMAIMLEQKQKLESR